MVRFPRNGITVKEAPGQTIGRARSLRTKGSCGSVATERHPQPLKFHTLVNCV